VTQPRRGSAASCREKMAADAVAAAVFGEVLTAADVQRLRRREGALARFVPTLLRTHSHPSARHWAGLAAATGTPGRRARPEVGSGRRPAP